MPERTRVKEDYYVPLPMVLHRTTISPDIIWWTNLKWKERLMMANALNILRVRWNWETRSQDKLSKQVCVTVACWSVKMRRGILCSAYYENNHLMDSVQSYFDRQTKSETTMVKGRAEGLVKEYYPSGVLQKEVIFQEQKSNRSKNILPRKGSIEQTNLTNGIITQYFCKTYYRNSKLESSALFKSGEEMGDWLRHYDSLGILLLDAHILKGKYLPSIALFSWWRSSSSLPIYMGGKVGKLPISSQTEKCSLKKGCIAKRIGSNGRRFCRDWETNFRENFYEQNRHGADRSGGADGKTLKSVNQYENGETSMAQGNLSRERKESQEETYQYNVIIPS